jgi:hypothetical protein
MTTSKEQIIVVCARITTPLLMADNDIGECSECGWKVQFRPHAPKSRKVCMECASDQIEPDTKVKVPRRMLEDLRDFYRKKQS